ncbi:MAG: hypothetical protein D6706_11915, partial [Chloroflexi bacterium]
NTPTITPTPTPSNPYLVLIPDCATGPTVQFNVIGVNWPTNEEIVLYWDVLGNLVSRISAGHSGSFSQSWTRNNVTDGDHSVIAVASGGYQFTATFTVPCDDATPLPTTTATPTPTPAPADLIVVGPPELVSTPPIVAYQPVTFRVTISNTGDVDINNQFFVDLYFDPTTIFSTTIPIAQSSGYVAVSSLAGKTSRVLTITSQIGFQNQPTNHMVYGMVDSIEEIVEPIESNNISTPFSIDYVTPANTPTPTPTPIGGGIDTISGVVRSLNVEWLPQFRAIVSLIDESTSTVVATTLTDQNGFYQFNNLPAGTYSVTACVTIDNQTHFGIRTGLTPPNPYGDIFMLPGPCS